MRCFGRFLFLVVFGVLVATSCERDELGEVVRLSSNKIVFDVGWADGSAVTKAGDGSTAASGSVKDFLFQFGADSLFMYVSQEPNRSFAPCGAEGKGQTRASAIKAVSSFNVAAFTNSRNSFIVKDKIEVNDGTGLSDRYWPESDPLNFFAWASSVTPVFGTANEAVTVAASAPVGGGGYNLSFPVESGVDAATCRGSFSYVMPTPGTEPESAADAVNQPDLIFAITTNKTKTSNSGIAQMEFHHALSAIHFKIGEMPAWLTVKSIAIKGVYSSGNCSFEPNPSQEKPLDLSFEWTGQSGPGDYLQNFNLTIPDNDRAGLGTLDEVNSSARKEAVFMLVPQSIPESATLEIVFEVNSPDVTDKNIDDGYLKNTYTLSKKFSEITGGPGSWEADKKYVYVISTPAEVDVEIEDQVEGYVKSNLKITNTGLSESYVRAAIVGYWILKRDTGGGGIVEDIVAAWNPAQSSAGGDGDFAGLPGANWERGSDDGFYYYKRTVAPKAEIADKLFTSYTLISSPPIVGAELRLSILVQSVIADRIAESGWPVTVTDGVMTVN